MKNIGLVTTFLIFILLLSCSPKLSTKLDSANKYQALSYDKEVLVYGMGEEMPSVIEELGTVKVGDSGFTTKCDYDVVIAKAKEEARKAGGNSLLITEHKTPDLWSSCHRITAKILITAEPDSSFIAGLRGSSIEGKNYALLHVYRMGGSGLLVNYDLHLGDSTICKMKNNTAETITITKDGMNTLWAKTETKTEVPIKIEFGKEYYIRCGISMGIVVGRPTISVLNATAAKAEFQSTLTRNKQKK